MHQITKMSSNQATLRKLGVLWGLVLDREVRALCGQFVTFNYARSCTTAPTSLQSAIFGPIPSSLPRRTSMVRSAAVSTRATSTFSDALPKPRSCTIPSSSPWTRLIPSSQPTPPVVSPPPRPFASKTTDKSRASTSSACKLWAMLRCQRRISDNAWADKVMQVLMVACRKPRVVRGFN